MAPRAKKKLRASTSTTASPPRSPPVTSNELFSNDEQYERFSAHFFERPILEGRYLGDEFMEPGKFEFVDILTKAGLKDFVTYKCHYYPELVRVFYNNMRISDSGVIRSEVKKVKMTIKPSLFHKLTSIPSVGVPFEGTVVDDWKEEYNPITARELICKEGEYIKGRLLAGKLKFETRLLHYVICRILTTEEDIMLLWALLNSVEINWGHLIRHRMKKATKDNALLPYPHLITIFMEHFGIQTGNWVYKEPVRNVQEVHENEEQDVGIEEPENRQEPENPVESSSASLTEVIKEIRDLRMFVGERLDRIENRIGVVEQEVVRDNRAPVIAYHTITPTPSCLNLVLFQSWGISTKHVQARLNPQGPCNRLPHNHTYPFLPQPCSFPFIGDLQPRPRQTEPTATQPGTVSSSEVLVQNCNFSPVRDYRAPVIAYHTITPTPSCLNLVLFHSLGISNHIQGRLNPQVKHLLTTHGPCNRLPHNHTYPFLPQPCSFPFIGDLQPHPRQTEPTSKTPVDHTCEQLSQELLAALRAPVIAYHTITPTPSCLNLVLFHSLGISNHVQGRLNPQGPCNRLPHHHTYPFLPQPCSFPFIGDFQPRPRQTEPTGKTPVDHTCEQLSQELLVALSAPVIAYHTITPTPSCLNLVLFQQTEPTGKTPVDQTCDQLSQELLAALRAPVIAYHTITPTPSCLNLVLFQSWGISNHVQGRLNPRLKHLLTTHGPCNRLPHRHTYPFWPQPYSFPFIGDFQPRPRQTEPTGKTPVDQTCDQLSQELLAALRAPVIAYHTITPTPSCLNLVLFESWGISNHVQGRLNTRLKHLSSVVLVQNCNFSLVSDYRAPVIAYHTITPTPSGLNHILFHSLGISNHVQGRLNPQVKHLFTTHVSNSARNC
ncbi:hypothetical protein V8G54_027860 [Vigna mungo]|uniref:Putative plant transposon protein domain-containing protein n=1 Tax=Vigna mungo TaxID=3915 RepID=A0AAQ3MQE1_VIGMU